MIHFTCASKRKLITYKANWMLGVSTKQLEGDMLTLISVIAAILLCLTSTAFAANIYIGTGQTYTTLSAALPSIQNGDSVILENDITDSTFILKKDFVLTGKPDTIKKTYTGFLSMDSCNIVISGLSIIGKKGANGIGSCGTQCPCPGANGGNGGNAIYATNSHLTIINCTINGGSGGGGGACGMQIGIDCYWALCPAGTTGLNGTGLILLNNSIADTSLTTISSDSIDATSSINGYVAISNRFFPTGTLSPFFTIKSNRYFISIEYSIARPSNVVATICRINGSKIIEFGKYGTAGKQAITFNKASLCSGVYLAVLVIDGIRYSRQVMVLK
jgi:hypothetical protein